MDIIKMFFVFEVFMSMAFCVTQFVIYHQVFKFVIRELRKDNKNEI